MYATIRRIKANPGKVGELAELIDTEYLPLIEDTNGFVAYVLVDIGDDEVTSTGLFADHASAEKANQLAREWTAASLGPLVASPLEATAGTVLVSRGKLTT